MDDKELEGWFAANKALLETAYIAGKQPWQQSGVGLRTPRDNDYWETLRRPVADCITKDGSFLDIGCANGYLLECVLRWTSERGLLINPFGLDFSEKLIDLARARLPQYTEQLFLGNAWNWLPPRQFDVVHALLEYVPEELQEAFVQRLLERYVQPTGCLLVAEYSGRHTDMPEKRIDGRIKQWGLPVEMVRSSYFEPEPTCQTHVAVIRKTA
ncbi:class I SAM-dependent methyltransferase [Dictyobacter aurantiacus]|uniref:Methyltransferase domain-containing protein n=1 Tax=Dictyobacter aurantiacus TaxID=1936993 RepID=A0A401ZD86_9CHLR|nr:class I SAM-dependent methyltransferase [Dictyobacter aurantiacus]GCE04851.1 hypothetical protein KDAU_21800 [Dictyobacter aurantiacus]